MTVWWPITPVQMTQSQIIIHVWKDCGKRNPFQSCTLHLPPVKGIWLVLSISKWLSTPVYFITVFFLTLPIYLRNCYTLWTCKVRTNLLHQFSPSVSTWPTASKSWSARMYTRRKLVYTAFNIEKGTNLCFFSITCFIYSDMLWGILFSSVKNVSEQVKQGSYACSHVQHVRGPCVPFVLI
jgi:hypothetical protein